MEQDRPRPPAARWLQPNPVPFWGSRIFRWNLVFLAVLVAAAAIWMLVIAPKLDDDARAESLKAFAAKKFVPRDPASKEPREVRFDGVLDRTIDPLPLELMDHAQDEPYRFLVKHLATMDSSKLAEQAKYVDYKTIMEKSEEVRGLTVRLNLLFWRAPHGPVRLQRPVGAVETITRAYLAESRSPKEIYIVDFVDPLPEIEPETPMIVDAVYLRRVEYERAGVSGWHKAPLFVARSVAKVQEPKAPSQYRFMGVAILLGFATLAFLSYLTIKMFFAARSGGPTPRRIPN